MVRDGGRRVLVVDPPSRARERDRRYQDALDWTGALLERLDVRRSVRIDRPHWRVMQVHQGVDGREIYFFVNTHRTESTGFRAFFPTGDRTPWRWDPETGARAVYPHDRKDELDIHLRPLESLLLVFEPGREGEPSRRPAVDEKDDAAIATPWELTLDRVDGRVETRTLESLVDLGLSDDPFFQSFGGTVTYRTTFEMDGAGKGVLDLGRVCGCSDVTLNGKALGVRWYGEHRYDVRGVLRSGRNELAVKVATVLSNWCRQLDEPTAKRWTARHRPVSTGLVGPVRLLGVKD